MAAGEDKASMQHPKQTDTDNITNQTGGGHFELNLFSLVVHNIFQTRMDRFPDGADIYASGVRKFKNLAYILQE